MPLRPPSYTVQRVTSSRSLPRLRILLIGRQDCPVVQGVGSIEHTILAVADTLAREHHVTVVSCGRGAYIANPQHRLNIDPLDDPGLYGQATPLGVAYRVGSERFDRVAVSATADVPDVALALHADVVVAHDDPLLAIDVALPVVFVAHSSPRFWGLAHPERIEAALSAASAIGATSRFLASQVALRSLRDDVTHIPLFAPDTYLDVPLLEPHLPRVLFASRLMASSGLVDLCALWRRQAPDAELAIVDFPSWDAPRRESDELRSFARSTPNTRLIEPWRAQADGAKVFASSPVLACCPIDDEPSLAVVLEARAAGCRIVGFSHPALDEAAGPAALLVPRGDHRALKEAIKEALRTATFESRQRERDSVSLSHPLSNTVAAYEALIQEATR